MQIQTVLLIILAAIIAFLIVYYHYLFKVKNKGKLAYSLASLRFISFFCLGLLLINPKITKDSFSLEKANLILLTDNSSSIEYAKGEEAVENAITFLKGNEDLASRFNTHVYAFGSDLKRKDILSFSESYTNIGGAIASANKIYSGDNVAYVILTDGNQNLGEDYEFYTQRQKNSIFPIVIGDTTRFDDLRIDQVNVNQYAFLKNQYPVEILLSYNGNSGIETLLSITKDGKSLYKENIALNRNNRTMSKTVLLKAEETGIQNLKIDLKPLSNEKNLSNNKRQIAVEVIDEKTNIALVSNVMHPDLGALIKSIETNEQRRVTLYKPSAVPVAIDSFDIVLLYQPDRSFKDVYKEIENRGLHYFTFAGTETDWTFLNEVQNSFQMNSLHQKEEVFPIVNEGFTKFDVSNLDISDLPPLQTVLGEILITTNYENILEQRVKGIALNEPLLSILETNDRREAVLFGEDIWKWRMAIYKEDKSFKRFDALWSKIIFYLSDSNPKRRLTLSYDNVFLGSGSASVRASYFDDTYVFDAQAQLVITLQGGAIEGERVLPMLLNNGYYDVDLSSLPAGNYSFVVTASGEKIQERGTFTILEYDLEKQSFSSNYQKLNRTAIASGGNLFYPDQLEDLVVTLMRDNRYVPVQKSNQNVVSLIDFKILLAVIAFALAAEWFIRKYFGLI